MSAKPSEHPDAVHPAVPLHERGREAAAADVPKFLKPQTAPSLMRAGMEIMEERAREYDSGTQGERSIASVVRAFNAISGRDSPVYAGGQEMKDTDPRMTEAEGWLFMQLLKARRLFSAPGFHQDSAVDGINYAALTGEAKAREHGQ